MTSREYRERLIDEVQKYPVLYDTGHEHHRDIDVRDRCWVEIAARIGTNSEVLKREWKILRDSLRQALKKSRGGLTTKSGAPCKKWRFQARMAFVLPYMTRRNQRQAIRSHEDMKPDAETEASDGGEADEWSGAAREASAVEVRAEEAGDADSLELFFASVCSSARRLPRPLQRALKRSVLDALHAAERSAERPPAAGGEADSKLTLYDNF